MTGLVPERSVIDALLALLALTEVERETWIDVHLVELSQVDVARRDGVSEAAVSQRLRSAESKLRLGSERALVAA